ncbi:MAG: aminotransferase class V-fold PLP-dependent enzyme [Alphaproteobacteria bacterium]|nr:aminotransferase class V-fold PLP-dependent enzyme [Alphaproteobacteria bacterium]
MNKIIYLDAAASALKPDVVINAERDFLLNSYANTGRGVCARAAAADEMLANARATVADFICAKPNQVIFTSGTTDAMNRIVNIVRGTRDVKTIAVSDIDHHSARMPWENTVRGGHAELVKIPLTENYDIDLERVPSADVMVITAMSNVLGVPQDVKKIIQNARSKNPNVITIVDAAQYVAHGTINVAEWDCDFLCFSGHKIGSNTGIGVMYIKSPDGWAPDKFGGGMVQTISGDTWNIDTSPNKFEAGTLPLTQICGLPFAIDAWRNWYGGADILSYIYDGLSKIPHIKLLTRQDAKIISFVVDDMHVLDFGSLVGAAGVCLRVGNMCASWIHDLMGIPGSIRISVGPWNTMTDAEQVVDIIRGIVK